MAEERNENEFTRGQAIGIQSLALANQTIRECFMRFTGEEQQQPDRVRNFVLATAAAYRDFINEQA